MYFSLPLSFSLSSSLCRTNSQAQHIHTAEVLLAVNSSSPIRLSEMDLPLPADHFLSHCPHTVAGQRFDLNLVFLTLFLCMRLTSVRHAFVWRIFDICFLVSSHLINTLVVLQCLCQMLQVKYHQNSKITALYIWYCWRHTCCLTRNMYKNK